MISISDYRKKKLKTFTSQNIIMKKIKEIERLEDYIIMNKFQRITRFEKHFFHLKAN